MENWQQQHGLDVFAAVDVPGFEDAALQAFESTPGQHQGEIVLHYPSRRYLMHSLSGLSRARSYRSAESILLTRVRPLAARMLAHDVPALLGAVKNNDQIWNASGAPGALAEFVCTLHETGQLGPSAPWDDLRQFVGSRGAVQFNVLWEVLANHGVKTTPAPAESEVLAEWAGEA